MKCPFCSELNNKVVDSRLGKDGLTIRRRRECLECEKRFTTYETVESPTPLIIKRNKQKEEFDFKKLKISILKATQKSSLPIEVVENFLERFEHQLINNNLKEMHSYELGDKISSFLKTHDPVAYLRYASVFKEFQTLDDFKKEIANLK